VGEIRQLMKGLSGEWLKGEPVSLEEMQRARIFALEELGLTVEAARDSLAAEFPLIARELLRREYEQAKAERLYWQSLSNLVADETLPPSEAAKRFQEFSREVS
jgi:hypothetical protein